MKLKERMGSWGREKSREEEGGMGEVENKKNKLNVDEEMLGLERTSTRRANMMETCCVHMWKCHHETC